MYLYPLWVRLWHFINAVLIIILIVTGIILQHTGSDSSLLTTGFARAVRWHNVAAMILTLNYLVFVAGNIISGNGKYYRISEKNLLSDLGKQIKYFSWGMFKREKQPFPVTLENKFNPLEKVSYFLLMYFVLPMLILSGIVLLFPDMTIIKTFGTHMYIVTDILHIILGLLVSLFLIIHIYICTIGIKPSSFFRGIITGYLESDE